MKSCWLGAERRDAVVARDGLGLWAEWVAECVRRGRFLQVFHRHVNTGELLWDSIFCALEKEILCGAWIFAISVLRKHSSLGVKSSSAAAITRLKRR